MILPFEYDISKDSINQYIFKKKMRVSEFEDKYLISVALNRRHLAEGQKAVLANEYRKILSKKRQSEAGKKANEVRLHSNYSSDLENVSQSDKNEADPSCKETFYHSINTFFFKKMRVFIIYR